MVKPSTHSQCDEEADRIAEELAEELSDYYEALSSYLKFEGSDTDKAIFFLGFKTGAFAVLRKKTV